MRKQVNVRLNEDLIKRLKVIAINEEMSFQSLIETLIIFGLSTQYDDDVIKDLVDKCKKLGPITSDDLKALDIFP